MNSAVLFSAMAQDKLVNGCCEMQYQSTLGSFPRHLNSELLDSDWIQFLKGGFAIWIFVSPPVKEVKGMFSLLYSEEFFLVFLLSLENSNSQNSFLWINALFWNTFCYLEFLKLKFFFGSPREMFPWCLHILQSSEVYYALKRWCWKWVCKKVTCFHTTVVI